MYPTNYRTLTSEDLKTISLKRYIFIKCKGYIFTLRNTKQAVIITYEEMAHRVKKHLTKRKAEIIEEITRNNKTYLLLRCDNLASIKALCKRQQIKTPNKIKRVLKINDLILDKSAI